MEFAAYGKALTALDSYLARQRAGTAESEVEFLAAHAGLTDVLTPMLAGARGRTQAPMTVTPITAVPTAPTTPSSWRGLPEVGETIGGYRIERPIGQGGMGVVFLAQDTRLQRMVALKLVRPERLGSAAARERFWREAKLAARLEHPNICPVYEIGEAQGVPFMAMRFLQGETLAAQLESAPPLPRDGTTPGGDARRRLDGIVQVIETTARALHFAHEHGVVHRDVKPANILIEANAVPIVLDFGMARGADDDLGLTMTGELAGTPLYMAPEQVTPNARGVDHRADVYALGVTLYEAATGVRPFGGQSMRELLDAIVKQQPPPASRHNRVVPKDLDVVIEKAIEKDTGRRYRTALDFAEDLARVRAHVPVLARRAGPLVRVGRWTQRNPLATAFLLLVATALLATTFLSWRLATTQRDFNLLSFVPRVDDLAKSELGLYAEWPDHEAALAAWDETAARLETEFAQVRAYVARLDADAAAGDADNARRALNDKLRSTVVAFDTMGADEGVIPRVRRNLWWLRRERGEIAADAAQAWPAVATTLRADARLAGVDLAPQVGLMPLGADPITGLFEFWHPRSGDRPTRDARGQWQIGEATGMVFVLLPGGTFMMGSQKESEELANYDPLSLTKETPVNDVPLSAFFISKYEVTQGQWMRLSGRSNPAFFNSTFNPTNKLVHSLANPVENVTWHECVDVLAQAGLTLPTEAQWEYAYRGGTTTPWWTGSSKNTLSGTVNIADATTADQRWNNTDRELDDGFRFTAPVDTLAPNGFGLNHIAGNVSEWCLDYFDQHAYSQLSCAPGHGLREPAIKRECVIRGAAFEGPARYARAAQRSHGDPSGSTNITGVRPARRVR